MKQSIFKPKLKPTTKTRIIGVLLIILALFINSHTALTFGDNILPHSFAEGLWDVVVFMLLAVGVGIEMEKIGKRDRVL